MAQIGNFDASQVEPSTAPEAIPAGWYPAYIKESEMKATANGAGEFLQLTMEIFNSPYAKALIFDRLNLKNANPVAVEIAYRTLSAICHATGKIQIQDSAQLHNSPFEVKVSLRPAGTGNDGKFHEASNEVKGYRKFGASGQAAPTSAAVAIPQSYTPPAAPTFQPPAAPTFQPPAAVVPVYTQPPVEQNPVPEVQQPWTSGANAPQQQPAPWTPPPAQGVAESQPAAPAVNQDDIPPWERK